MQAKLLHLPHSPARGVSRPHIDLAALLSGWLHNLFARRSLAGLDDRTLKDLGLTRGDVDREYERPFWEPVDHGALEAARRCSGPRLGR
ncbi:MAG: DUF1127 domain-containing protein [Geminicoccaceae bacterium]